jgi:hypothetical protein
VADRKSQYHEKTTLCSSYAVAPYVPNTCQQTSWDPQPPLRQDFLPYHTSRHTDSRRRLPAGYQQQSTIKNLKENPQKADR